AKQPAKPGKSISAEQLWPGIGKEFARRFQHVVQARSHNSSNSRDPDYDKPISLRMPPIEVELQDVRRNAQTGCNLQAKRWDRNRPQMQEWNHIFWIVLTTLEVYMSARIYFLPAAVRKSIRPRTSQTPSAIHSGPEK